MLCDFTTDICSGRHLCSACSRLNNLNVPLPFFLSFPFDLKVFEKEKVEPLQVKQQEVNWLGQGLIQSAAKNASTENLERDLEDVNTRWKTLNKKVR